MSFYKNINNIDERRLFAAMAMGALIADDDPSQSETLARKAVVLADALITELNKTKAICNNCNERPVNSPTAILCHKCAHEYKFK